MGTNLGHRSAGRTLVLGLIGITLAACAGPEPRSARLPPQPLGPETLQFVSHEVLFQTDAVAVAPTERAELEEFLGAAALMPGVEFIVIGHADARGTDSYNARLASGRAQEVATVISDRVDAPVSLRSLGERAPVVAGTGSEALQANRRVEVIASFHTAEVERCHYWTKPSATRSVPQITWAPLGCAADSNLVAMMAFPQDRVIPRTLGQPDPTREGKAIGRYRNDEVKAFIAEETK